MKDTKSYILDNLEGDKGSTDMTKIRTAPVNPS